MKSDFKQGRLGVAFKNGKLYTFTDTCVLVMSAWPDPRGWWKRRSHNWRPTRREANAVFSPNLFAKGTAYQPPRTDPDDESGWFNEWLNKISLREYLAHSAYFDTIPDSVRDDLLRYGSRKWHLLNLLARCPGADDLSRANPALAFALASNWVFHKPAVTRPLRAARGLVYRKQKRILEWLGFPPTEPVRRILAKIVPRSLAVESLLYLRTALADPWVMRILSHQERLNASVLLMVTHPRLRPCATPRLLAELGQSREEDGGRGPAVRLLTDTLRMAERFGQPDAVRPFLSLRQLQTVHDELATGLAPIRVEDGQPLVFPPPPFAGDADIRPLRTDCELVAEGREMQHCVSYHGPDVAAGWYYVYRVLTPVRATLAIRWRLRNWVLSEMHGVRNARIPADDQQRILHRLLKTPTRAVSETAGADLEWNGWPDPDPVGPWTRFDERVPTVRVP